MTDGYASAFDWRADIPACVVLCPLSGVKRTSQTTARLQGAAFRWPLSVMVYAATGAGVEAEEIADTNCTAYWGQRHCENDR